MNEVDGPNGLKHLRRAIAEKWRKPKPPIWGFIDSYRNAVLRRYEHPDVDFDMVIGSEYPRLVVARSTTKPVGVIDIVELVDMALQFCEDYLDDVDRRAELYEQIYGR